MTIEINYKTDSDGWCYAYTQIGENYYAEVSSSSFDIAKEKLIERIKEISKRMPTVIPSPEKVEIED